MRSRGLTLQAICDKLNEEGLPTPRAGKAWRPTSPARSAAQSLIRRSLTSSSDRTLAQLRPLTSHCALRVRSAECVRGWLHDVDDREARVDIEAGGREERGAEVTGEE
jgi:hypothetical protein